MKPSTLSRPRVPRRLAALVGVLIVLLAVAAARLLIFRPQAGPDAELEHLLKQVAARPAELAPRVALARHLTERELTFGIALELALLPPDAPREMREAAAAALLRLHQREKAAEIYRGLLRETPDPRLTAALAGVLREQGDFPGALAAVEAALAGSPEDPTLQRERLRSLLDVSDYTQVVALAEPMLLRQPQDPEIRSMLAWGHLLRGNAGETLVLLSALRPEQRLPWTDVLRGRALLAMKDAARLDEAAAAFGAAAAAAPDLFEAHAGLAETLVRAGRWQPAARAASQAVEAQPESSAAWQMLAQAYEALKLRPEADWCRGRVQLAREDPAAAQPHLRRAVAARMDSRFVRDLARTLFATSKSVEAYALLARAAGQDPEPELLRYWYNTAYDDGEFGQCVQAARILAKQPEPRQAAEGLGLEAQALREQGDREGAIKQLDRALEMVPGEPIMLAERGRTLLGAGSPDKVSLAAADLRQAAAGGPAVPPLYYDLAAAALAQDRPSEAFVYLCRNLTLLQDQDLAIPLSLMAKTCSRLKLAAEAKWCADWARDLQRAEDGFRVAASQPKSAGRDLEMARTAAVLADWTAVRAAYLRLTRTEPANAAAWAGLARACQRIGLYDERVAAMERWNALGGRPQRDAGEVGR